MSVQDLFKPLPLLRGPAMANRFMLGPLTTRQSASDGRASAYDIDWMGKAGRGGYGLVQTCAATVMSGGRTFLGQLGVHDDALLPGLSRIAAAIRNGGALSAVQLHHGGARVDPELGGAPMPVSNGLAEGVPGMSIAQIETLKDSFLQAALRAEKAGFDGAVLHGAFGFALSQFLSPVMNTRRDQYGGSLANRARVIFEIIDSIRTATGPAFQLGIRFSVERFGLEAEEIRDVVGEIMAQEKVDYVDLALWDSAQMVQEGPETGRKMLDLFTSLPRKGVRLGTAGKIMSARRAGELLDEGCDFAVIGRAAILHADFPRRTMEDPSYAPPALPVTERFLQDEGLSPPLIEYMKSTWPNFVQH